MQEEEYSFEGENERPSTSGPIRCRGVEKAANSSRGGRRSVWATPRILNGLGGLDYCLNRRSIPDCPTVFSNRRMILRSGSFASVSHC